MMRNYGTPPVALVKGKGCSVWDADDNEYLDLLSGIAVSTLGHDHPAITSAIANQSHALLHVSNFAVHEPGVTLAERLLGLLGMTGRVFFSQDGASANEAAYKLARKHGWAKDPTGGSLQIVAAEGSFHGRTMGALSITGSPPKRTPFEPLPGPVDFVPYGDVEALDQAVTDQTAAVFLEPIQGEAGVIVPPVGYLAAARAICDRAGALLVIDEVQSGIGRTGQWFASEGIRPDVITLAKGLAGGLPLGVCIGVGSAGDLFVPGDHGSTFGGNPVSVAAALAVLDTIEADNLLASTADLGAELGQRIEAFEHPSVAGQRGAGLWRAILLTEPFAPAVEQAARSHGFLVNAVKPDVIRLAPPLLITSNELNRFVEQLPAILDEAHRQTKATA